MSTDTPAAAPTAEREAFESAMKQSWQMVDALNPSGVPGSYARGEHNGICAALKTVRENFERAALSAPVAAPAEVGWDGEGRAEDAIVAWQWRRKGESWSLEKTFNYEVFATTQDSEVRALVVAPVAAQPAASGREVLQQTLAALETAHTGLMWYRGMMPEYVDGSDDEADEKITAAIEGLRTHLSTALTGSTHGR